jgi:hypothetical protein
MKVVAHYTLIDTIIQRLKQSLRKLNLPIFRAYLLCLEGPFWKYSQLPRKIFKLAQSAVEYKISTD